MSLVYTAIDERASDMDQNFDYHTLGNVPTLAITTVIERMREQIRLLARELSQRADSVETEHYWKIYETIRNTPSQEIKPCTYGACNRQSQAHGRCCLHMYPAGTHICGKCLSADYDGHVERCNGRLRKV